MMMPLGDRGGYIPIGPLKTRMVHGVELIEQDDKVIQDFTRRGLPTFEPESMTAWLSVARPGVTMIDVGAYTGIYAIAAAKAGALVYALEPNPEVFMRLRANLARNGPLSGSVICQQVAAGSENGRCRLVTSPARLTSGGRTVPEANGELRVETVDSLPRTGPVAAIKVDVEGNERDVLQGALSTLYAWTPLLILEAHTQPAADALMELLRPMGYKHRRADTRNLVCELRP